MPSCVGCGEHKAKGTSGEDFTLHTFPNCSKEPERFAEWLRFVQQIRPGFKASQAERIFLCNRHFAPEFYEETPQMMARMGLTVRVNVLKADAIPTVFATTRKQLNRAKQTGSTTSTCSSDSNNGTSRSRRRENIHHAQSSEPLEGDSKQESPATSETDINNADRQVQRLKFKNPGKFMEDFDPERSTREMRKVNRRIYRESLRKNQVYDEIGRLLTDSRDICDCLDPECKGCHFPCPKCASLKCGPECRCNRRWYYSETDVEGTTHRTTFPEPLPQPSY